MKIYEYYKNMEESFKENFNELYDEYVDEISEKRSDKDIINRIINEWIESERDITVDEDELPCYECEEKRKECDEGDWCEKFQNYLNKEEELKQTYIYNLQKYYKILTIKNIREKFNLTQKSMSEITGIPTRTIEDWESGKRKATDYLINLIAFYLENN